MKFDNSNEFFLIGEKKLQFALSCVAEIQFLSDFL